MTSTEAAGSSSGAESAPSHEATRKTVVGMGSIAINEGGHENHDQNQAEASERSQGESSESMTTQSEKESASWDNYRPIGSEGYKQANAERIEDGKIKVVQFGEPDHSVTLVASIKTDPATGHAVSGHEDRPEAQSMVDTQKAFEDYIETTPPEKRAIIYEGNERLFSDRDESIRRANDSGLIQHLGTKEGVEMRSGEPTESEVVSTLEQLGVGREELLALYVARGLKGQLEGEDPDFIAGYINHQAASLGIEGFSDYSDADKQRIIAEGGLDGVKAELAAKTKALLPGINELYGPALDGKDLFIADGDRIVVNPALEQNASDVYLTAMAQLNTADDHRINEIAKLNMEMRDRVIFHKILDAYNQGKSPFVVYGGSHVVTIGPAIKSYMESK